MASRLRAATSRTLRIASVARGGLLRGGAHHATGPYLPKGQIDPHFHRLPQPKGPLPEERDLVWMDGVAPEMMLDYDIPSMPAEKALMWLAGTLIAVYFVFWELGAKTFPIRRKQTAAREIPAEYQQMWGLHAEETKAKELREGRQYGRQF